MLTAKKKIATETEVVFTFVCACLSLIPCLSLCAWIPLWGKSAQLSRATPELQGNRLCAVVFFFPTANASYEANRYLAVWLACQMCLFVRLLLCSSLPAIITQFPRKSNCTLLSALCILLLSTAATVDREETALLTPEGITVYSFRRQQDVWDGREM